MGGILALKDKKSTPKSPPASAPGTGLKRPRYLQSHFEALLPSIKEMVNGPSMAYLRQRENGVEVPLTDQEVVDWMKCITDNASDPGVLAEVVSFS